MIRQKIQIVFAIGALLGCSGCASMFMPRQLKTQLRIMKVADLKVRISLWEKELRKNPNDLKNYDALHKEYLGSQQTDKALEVLGRAIARPESHNFSVKDFWYGAQYMYTLKDIYTARGQILFQRKEYDDALDDFSKAISAYTDLLSRAAAYAGGEQSMAGMVAGKGAGEIRMTSISDMRMMAKQTGMDILSGLYAQRAAAYAAIGNCDEAKVDMKKAREHLRNKKEYLAEVADRQQKQFSAFQGGNKSTLDSLAQTYAKELEEIKKNYTDKDAPDKEFIEKYFAMTGPGYATVSQIVRRENPKSTQECYQRIRTDQDAAGIQAEQHACDSIVMKESLLYKCIVGTK